MRKSLGGGGGGGNGGDTLRSVGRAVGSRLNNFQDSLPSPSNTQKTSSAKSTKNTSTSNHSLTLSSPNTHTPVSAAWPPPPPNYYVSSASSSSSKNGVGVNEGDENFAGDDKWECLENYYYYDPIFGAVPSTNEVQHALLSLQQVLDPQSCSASSTEEKPCEVDKNMDDQATSDAGSTLPRASSKGSDTSDWLEPSMHPYDWKVTQSPGWGTVHDAFHLLQNEPTVQRMVVSLSSDKAVWDAVLNNEAVQEIRDSYRDVAESFPASSDEQIDPSKADSSILKWIFDNMKMKLLEVLGSISQIVGDTVKPLDCDKEEQSFAFIEKLKSTFLLTVVVLLIVVVARGHMA